jgi:hypothetical protein
VTVQGGTVAAVQLSTTTGEPGTGGSRDVIIWNRWSSHETENGCRIPKHGWIERR